MPCRIVKEREGHGGHVKSSTEPRAARDNGADAVVGEDLSSSETALASAEEADGYFAACFLTSISRMRARTGTPLALRTPVGTAREVARRHVLGS